MVTDAYRISGSVQTRFARLTDILNQHARTHLTITHATISAHVDPTARVGVLRTRRSIRHPDHVGSVPYSNKIFIFSKSKVTA